MTDAVAVFVAAASEDEAAAIGRTLVEEHLAACVNIVPRVRSIYRWQGKVEDELEAFMIIKTTRDRVASLQVRVQELHSYEVPEIVALPIVAGLDAYVDWIRQNTRTGA